jgi:phospholipid transport system transporter-binding protein
MSAARLERLAAGRWCLSGGLTLASVGDLIAQGPRLAADSGDVVLDLAGVENSSSAGVALLLEWEEQIHRGGGTLRLHNCPEALARIAEFSNVDGLLGLDLA